MSTGSPDQGVPSSIQLVPPLRFLVAATAGARVVGKGGDSIRALRSTGATVKVFQEELPDVLKRRRENLVVTTCGEVTTLRIAVGGILDRIFDRSGLPETQQLQAKERPFVVDIIVPERACGAIVGPGGEQVKALMSESGCTIDVVREAVPGLVAQRRVRLLSRDRESVDRGVMRVHQVLCDLVGAEALLAEHFELREALPSEEDKVRLQQMEKGGGEVPVRILLAPGEAAVVVGRMGYNVAKLRDIAHVSVDDAVPPFLAQERICVISRADLADRLRVVRLVVADLANSSALRRGDTLNTGDEDTRVVSARILLPSQRRHDLTVPLGSPGEDLRSCKLTSESGAAVADRTLPGSPFLSYEISGTEEKVAAAVWRLHQTLEPWESVHVPPKPEKAPAKTAETEDEVERRPPRQVPRPAASASAYGDAGGFLFSKATTAHDTAFSNIGHSTSAADADAKTFVTATASTPAAVHVQAGSGDQRSAAGAQPPIDLTSSSSTWGRGQDDVAGSPHLPLLVAVPSAAEAAALASDRSGIAKKAGVSLRAPACATGPAIVEVRGAVEACAVACYLIQVRLWLSGAGRQAAGAYGFMAGAPW
eukprot:TRINITY_DN39908_c0_g2_i2.p1 TRINITY_DN39908_c0_g2~~TRINITY_DN39908_c0_g2_i2.p1  ORF type:complete len:595 (-),score=127.71 TRINITY_DN39908_c0_g2_i2:52-1836(-)